MKERTKREEEIYKNLGMRGEKNTEIYSGGRSKGTEFNVRRGGKIQESTVKNEVKNRSIGGKKQEGKEENVV